MQGQNNSAVMYISILAPTRGATIFGMMYTDPVKISILAPTRGATQRLPSHSPKGRNFNPRSHEGSDVVTLHRLGIQFYFNPRSHEGSDLKTDSLRLKNFLFQSSLPRGERHCSTWCTSGACTISILAPTRGATAIDPQLNSQYRFQSSLPRGERQQRDQCH